MARILIATFGSYGDLHPYLALGRELRRRDHAVTVATSEGYRTKVNAEDLLFHPVRPDIELRDRKFLEALFDRKRGSEYVIRYIASFARETYRDTLPAVEQADVVLTHFIAFSAVAAAQHLGKAWISTVLAPSFFLSAYDPPIIAAAPWLTKAGAFGPSFMKRVWDVGRRQARGWVRPVLDLRRELGLDTSLNPIFEGANSPELILALFSKLLAAPRRDWPAQAAVTGFCFHEHGPQEFPSRPELERFLDAGEPPVLFTLGSSAVAAAKDFYLQSAAAIARLGTRAVFLTGPFAQNLPSPLPPKVFCLEYAPHRLIMPRASVVVHQGGIGTTAEALRSGRPMLVVPFAHDQYDNAERARRLGVAEVLPRNRYGPHRAAKLLARLLGQSKYAKNGDVVARAIAAEDGPRAAADAVEICLTRKERPKKGNG